LKPLVNSNITMMVTKHWSFEVWPAANFWNIYSGLMGNFSIGEDTFEMPLHFVMSSPCFDKKTQPEKVLCIGQFIIALINGHANLSRKNKYGSNVARLGHLFLNGNKVMEDYDCAIDPLEIDSVLEELDELQMNSFGEFFDFAFKPGLVRNVLLHSNNGWTLANMYKIRDEIKLFIKEKGEIFDDYIDKKEDKAFGATTNNFAVSGLQARHGQGNGSFPKKNLTIDECTEFIRKLFNKVLENHFDLKLIYPQDLEDDEDLDSIFE